MGMFDIFKRWFGGDERTDKGRSNPVNTAIRRNSPAPKAPAAKAPAARAPAAKPKPAPAPVAPSPADLRIEPRAPGRVETVGRNKNVLIQNKYQREDTGTHDTLKIVDDSIVETGEEAGIDPYNTGKFDRSKNWDKRYR